MSKRFPEIDPNILKNIEKVREMNIDSNIATMVTLFLKYPELEQFKKENPHLCRVLDQAKHAPWEESHILFEIVKAQHEFIRDIVDSRIEEHESRLTPPIKEDLSFSVRNIKDLKFSKLP